MKPKKKKVETVDRIVLSFFTVMLVFILMMAPSLVPAVFAAAGSLDPTFGTGGKVLTPNFPGGSTDDEIKGVVIQTDGKIVAAGRTNSPRDFALARYDGDVIHLFLPLISKRN